MYKLSATALHTCHSESDNFSKPSCTNSPQLKLNKESVAALQAVWGAKSSPAPPEAWGSRRGSVAGELAGADRHGMKREQLTEEGAHCWEAELNPGQGREAAAHLCSCPGHAAGPAWRALGCAGRRWALALCQAVPGGCQAWPAPAAAPPSCNLPPGPLDTVINMQRPKRLAKIITQRVNWLAKLIMQGVR